MPRPKKEGLSEAVGSLSSGRKRGNPDFISSSFYAPKKVNTAFNRALLTLKDADIDVDRSDILTILMERFAEAVEAADRDGDVGLDSILAAAGETMVSDAAIAVVVRNQMHSVIAEMQKDNQAQIDSLQKLLAELGEKRKSSD